MIFFHDVVEWDIKNSPIGLSHLISYQSPPLPLSETDRLQSIKLPRGPRCLLPQQKIWRLASKHENSIITILYVPKICTYKYQIFYFSNFYLIFGSGDFEASKPTFHLAPLPLFLAAIGLNFKNSAQMYSPTVNSQQKTI